MLPAAALQLRLLGSPHQAIPNVGTPDLSIRKIVNRYLTTPRPHNFTADNDPHGEHDFGSFELVGVTYFFKLDYYSPNIEAGSEDPADPEKTTRVLTIMRADEY